MKSIQTPDGAIAVYELVGRGPAVVIIHGNSSSSRAFSRQLEGPLGQRFRLIAVDLPGHGASCDAEDPNIYSLPGYARAIREVLDALGLRFPRFIGWSMGGAILLEMAPDLPEARGFLIFGTPPVALPQLAGSFLAVWTRTRSLRNASNATRRPPSSARSLHWASVTFRHSLSRTSYAPTGARESSSEPA